MNNAGVFETAILQDISVAQWDAMVQTNTRGPFLMSKAAYPSFEGCARAGSTISGRWAGYIRGRHGQLHVKGCSAHADADDVEGIAPEISVNCVAPGMIVNGEVTEDYEHFAHKTPMKRNGTPEDVAAAVMFFAMGPHFITGQILSVDGGLGL